MTRQTTQQTKPFLENGLINDEYLYDTRISNAKIEGNDSWQLMLAMKDLYLADIGTIQADRIQDEISALEIFDETIYLDEITVRDLIDKIERLENLNFYPGLAKLQKILEQLKQLDRLGFVQKVTEKRLSNGRI